MLSGKFFTQSAKEHHKLYGGARNGGGIGLHKMSGAGDGLGWGWGAECPPAGGSKGPSKPSGGAIKRGAMGPHQNF